MCFKSFFSLRSFFLGNLSQAFSATITSKFYHHFPHVLCLFYACGPPHIKLELAQNWESQKKNCLKGCPDDVTRWTQCQAWTFWNSLTQFLCDWEMIFSFKHVFSPMNWSIVLLLEYINKMWQPFFENLEKLKLTNYCYCYYIFGNFLCLSKWLR